MNLALERVIMKKANRDFNRYMELSGWSDKIRLAKPHMKHRYRVLAWAEFTQLLSELP